MSSSLCETPDALEVERSTSGRPSKLVRALHVINGEHYSGAERVQDLLALNLKEFGFEVGFACLKPGRFDALRSAKEAPLRLFEMGSRLDLRPAWNLAQWVRKDRYALIHTHTPRAAMVGRLAAWMAGVPMVHHVHSPTGRDSTRSWQDRLNSQIENLSLTRVSAVIAVSRSLATYVAEQGVPRLRIYVVPNGVPVVGPLATRSRPKGAWVLGTVALFRPRKGLEVLLHSLAQLRAAGRDVRLRAIGDFETAQYRRQIFALVGRLALESHVEWTGFTSDVPAELARLDLFVLPSLFGEGLPMVVLEAMAAGIPVVGTRVEGVPEAIRDGCDGVLAAPNDSADLARAIEAFIDGSVNWTACREHAHRRQAEIFSAESMARGVAEVYREVLKK